MKKNENIVERCIYGNYFLIDITENYFNEKAYLYEINELGHFIWSRIDGKKDISIIAKEILEAVVDDVKYEDVFEDTEAYINILIDKGFVTRRTT